jgi:RNA polymerase sigma-70 factor (ECF subfamily)
MPSFSSQTGPPFDPDSDLDRSVDRDASTEGEEGAEIAAAGAVGEADSGLREADLEAPDADSGSKDRGSVPHSGQHSPQDSPQPGGEDRVREDMATLAVNPEFVGRGSRDLGAERITTGTSRVAGDFSGMDDAAIMLELSAGNMAAFDVLIQKYRKPIIHFMYRMVRNEAVAEELAQEVFLRVYRSRETYRAEARFSTWLYRIATNLGVNHARDTRHERSASTIYLDETDSETGTTPDVADSTPSAESGLLRDERMAAIREHVMALPERQRMAVLMHKYEGMDYKQIGDVLKLSESATKSLLFRAYQTLREKLKDFI